MPSRTEPTRCASLTHLSRPTQNSACMHRSTVIAAFQNIADGLKGLQSDAETLKAAYAAERAAFKHSEIARRQPQLGAIG